MDGTLISTEDLYTEAYSDLLAEYGKGPLTWDIKVKLQGLPGSVSNKLMVDHYELPVSTEEYASRAMEIQATKWHKADFLPGALELIKYLKDNEVPIALGTSSNKANFELKTKHLGELFDLFGEHIVTGDDERIPKGKGKPNPDIWYTCLDSINKDRESAGLHPIPPEECLVFEDGLPGVLSGIAANSHVVWIPHPDANDYLDDFKKDIAGKDVDQLPSLLHFEKARYGL